ncbi:unnamed protein product, partial [Mesorhabditis belari]|uniref:Rab-GAP TBC domain-containing protein n=1 Tax=Mesorhabditis belari TaxID=2138241 RepID=A0AAF3EEM6_9BILA
MRRYLRREKRWLSILKQQPRSTPCNQLTDLVWEGIPNKLRIKAWPHLLNVNFFKKVHGGHKIYIELMARARLISKHVKQIDLDIGRTYRHHVAFRRRYDIKQQSLFNVLVAYSVYNTEIGYCQGMSQIVALLLMFLDEEEAFWCLHTLMISPKHSMHGFFVSGFPKLQRFEAHFKALLKNYEPRIYENFERELIPFFFVTKWWFGCFLDRVPFPLALRLWDIFLLEGDQVLMAMALNIMEMHSRTIRMLSLEKFMEFIQSRLSDNFGYSDDDVMNNLRKILYKIRRDNHHPKSPILQEGPQRPFGSVLEHTMMDIHEHVHDIRMQFMNISNRSTGLASPKIYPPNGRTLASGDNPSLKNERS